jgi:hypothetical protein
MEIPGDQIVNLKKNGSKRESVDGSAVIEKEITKTVVDRDADDFLEWQVKEFIYRPKTIKWFVLLTLAIVMIELYFLWTKSFFAFATFLLIFFVILLYSVKKPDNLSVRLDYKGVRINNKLYKFDDLQSFWIFYNPPGIKKIFFKRKGIISQSINISIGEQDPAALRSFLLDYLSEVEEEEPLIDILVRKIGF